MRTGQSDILGGKSQFMGKEQEGRVGKWVFAMPKLIVWRVDKVGVEVERVSVEEIMKVAAR